MKKFLVAMAAVLAMTVSINAKEDAKSCPNAKKCDKMEQCDKKPGDPRACLFEGLNLTDAQKGQIQELTKACADKQKADKDQKKADRKDARKQCKQDMLAQLKGILTPEQYVQFLENSFLYGGDQGRMAPAKGQKGGKGFKHDGPRGQRPEAKTEVEQ